MAGKVVLVDGVVVWWSGGYQPHQEEAYADFYIEKINRLIK